MNIIQLFKDNIKLCIIMAIIILLGTIGVTLAININSYSIAINTTSSIIDANITYDEGTNTANVVNNGNMFPISDSLITGPSITDSRVLKVAFNVTGEDSNPDNTIYDVAMYFDQIDCVLRTTDLKWRLYKNNNLLNEGTLSPIYDTMANNRLVLTNTQENLTTSTDKYTFLLWISESCTGDITECDPSMDQSKYLNKTISGSIKIELSTGNTKEINRITGEEASCDYIETEVPVCNMLTYNGQEQLLVGENSSATLNNTFNYKILPLSTTQIVDTTAYSINNNTGVDAGNYPVILKLKDGYKWTDGSTNDKCIYCSIKKKNIVITTLDQTIEYGEQITSNSNNINVLGLIDGHNFGNLNLSGDTYDIGTGLININNVKILDEEDNDVTKNYSITKKNTGKVTINCLRDAEEPVVSNKDYTGSNQTGVINGRYIDIHGIKTATDIGTYSLKVVPQKNYCWSDGTTTEKTYTWNITGTKLATIYYYNGTSQTSVTSTCKIYDNSSPCTFTIPSVVTSSIGLNSASFYGLSVMPSSSAITTVYNSNNLNYYAVYKGSFTATYTKEDTVSSIGSTSNSCTSYKTTNGTTYTGLSCNVTLPTINVDSNYKVLGWYNASNTKIGDVGSSITLSSNQTFTAKGEKQLTSSDFSYDGTNSGSSCTDVTCALDELYEGLN